MCKRLFFAIYIFLGLGYLSSCQETDFLSDQQEAVTGMDVEALSKSCTLYIDGNYPLFADDEGTRAGNGQWEDGDEVYIRLSNGVYGKGVYSASSQSWGFSYKGTLSETDGASCKVYHCPGAALEVGTTTLQLDEKNPVFSDEGATYVYQQEIGELSIQASLEPVVWRMRFAEDYGASPITVYANDNVTYPSALDISTGTLSAETGKRYVGHDETSYGYSSYIYAMPLSSDTELSLEIDFKIYERTLSAAKTVKGSSGRFTRPTQSSHNGWTMKDLPVALISNGTVFNDKIRFLANGKDLGRWEGDTLITQIIFDYNSDVSTGTIVSSEESGIPIYANYSDGVMTISTSAAEIHLGQDASSMFRYLSSIESLDLSHFVTQNVQSMIEMFKCCYNLRYLDISKFNTSNVSSMYCMFYDCSSLTNLDVSHFDTSNVNSMVWMFSNCSSLTSLDVSNFDTRNVTGMMAMFQSCSSLTSLDVSNFDTGKVTNMGSMFSGCFGLTSLDLSNFDTSNVNSMERMFSSCSSLTSLDVSHFDTSNVTGMERMFYGCSSLTSLDVSHFDTGNVNSMDWMFFCCSSLTSLDVSHFDTRNVTNMSTMFCGCSGLTSLDVSHFDTGKVADMNNMFNGCSGLTSLDLSNFDTSNVTDMSAMFFNCFVLTSLDISHFNTSNVTNMGSMFHGCQSITNLDLSNFDTGNVISMDWMFTSCSSLTSLDLSNFNIGNVTNMTNMFTNVKNCKIRCTEATKLFLSSETTGIGSTVTFEIV